MNEQRFSLDGVWDFQFDSENNGAIPLREWRSVIVPMPWQAQFDDLRETSGVAWYRRSFLVNPDALQANANAAILHFGAVDYQATVWLKGRPLGEHEGGWRALDGLACLRCKTDRYPQITDRIHFVGLERLAFLTQGDSLT